MLRSKTFTKVTKKGSLVNVVREHYLRDDIGCGIENCPQCSELITEPLKQALQLEFDNANQLVPHRHYIVLDTNILIHQMDVIQHSYFKNIIICQTVLDEVKSLSLAIYQRLKLLTSEPERHFYVFSNEHHRSTFIERNTGETDNDRNDRAIRVVCEWYLNHIQEKFDGMENIPHVVFITNDIENRTKATSMGLSSYSLKEYIENVKDVPELFDMLNITEEGFESEALQSEKFKYEEYLTISQLHEGIKKGKYISGTISMSPYNLFEGSFIANYNGRPETIWIIDRKNLNRAIHGDTVVIEILPKAQWIESPEERLLVNEDTEQKLPPVITSSSSTLQENMHADNNKITAKVIGILKRNVRQYCGSLEASSSMSSSGPSSFPGALQWAYFTPLDRRVPKIKIRTRNASLFMGKRIVVAIDTWTVDSLKPFGHFIRSLGPSGDKNTETEALLLEHDIPVGEFTKAVLQCLPGADWTVDRLEMSDPTSGLIGREDLRDLNVCSIDPPGCTDIDDALHIRDLGHGLYEVGVHIADVSHFVSSGTALDLEAAKRGTTVYLVDKRIDMLPELLGTNLCSLKSNVDRFAFSCIWTLDESAKIVSVRFTKSIIHSKASLTYDEAQARLEDKHLTDSITLGIRALNQLAKKLRAARIEAGAITLASPEVRFSLENESQDPVDVEMKELKETNALVEEFMLLANISVAQKISQAYPEVCLLRRHPAPPEANFESFIRAALTKGVVLQTSSSKDLARSLDEAILPEEPYFNKLLRIMTTRCMMQAVYFCSGSLPFKDYWHYGLATEIYTHFTSPIRRYAVHRLLAVAIGGDKGSPPWNGCTRERVGELCENLNYRHRMAQLASRSSVELYTYLFFKGKTLVEEAYVIKVFQNGLVVLIPKYGIEGLIKIEALPEAQQTMSFDPKKFAFVNPHSQSPLVQIFDKIQVKLTMAEEDLGTASIQRQKLNVTWINAPFQLLPETEVPPSKTLPTKRKGNNK